MRGSECGGGKPAGAGRGGNEWFDVADAWRNDRSVTECGCDRLDRLEAVAGDTQHDLVIGTEVPRLGQRQGSGDGCPAANAA